jgi:hypothetical protein
MTDTRKQALELIEEYRDRCLWFLRPDYVPDNAEELRSVLSLIERYGDQEGYRRAEELKACL